MSEKTDRSVRLLSFSDDQPNELLGSLIPPRQSKKSSTRSIPSRVGIVSGVLFRTSLGIGAVAAFLFAFVSAYGYISSPNTQVAAPTITIVDPYTFNKVALSYGPQESLSQSNFFGDTRDAFIDEGITFVEVDLDAKTLRYFEAGVLVQSTEIVSLGEEGSWWDVPSGLYQIDKKEEREFSTAAQAYFPHAVTFEGNYVVHGMPQYPDGSGVPVDFKGGGIRISDDAAKKFFDEVEKGVTVLVHQKRQEADQFVYEPTVPTIDTQHYLIADIKNGSILAASDLNIAVPIASLTKLMTAVVTAEKLDLDSRVQVTSPSFVESLVPRLKDRSSVSMYSLLQLLLVESSNEAAEVIAGEYGRAEFIEQMNTKASQIGMTTTKFSDPSGVGPQNVSSLGDLYRLSQYIHENRQFIFDITADGEISSLEGMNEFDSLQNFNDVEGVDSFVGGKVGETTAAGQTSISLHTVTIQGSERTVVVILLGSAHRGEDVRQLIHFVEERFKR